jgi:hypothetical protein
MKVKLVQGKLVVEDDQYSSTLNIVTPNGHTTTRKYPCSSIPCVNWYKESGTTVKRFSNVKFNDTITTLINSATFGQYIIGGFCATKETTYIDWVFDFGTQTWYPVWVDINGDASYFTRIFEDFEASLVRFILQYDRECENAKYLRVMGEFCIHLLGRPKVLDLFHELSVQNSSTDQKDPSSVKPL